MRRKSPNRSTLLADSNAHSQSRRKNQQRTTPSTLLSLYPSTSNTTVSTTTTTSNATTSTATTRNASSSYTYCMLLGSVSVVLWMGWSFLSIGSKTVASSSPASVPAVPEMSSRRTIAIGQESRVRAALWSFFAGDALSAPSHWYYGGLRQIQGDYGPAGIAGYVQPVTKLPGSILNKSDLSGGGRSSGGASSRRAKNANSAVPVPVPAVLPPSIIGHVINHGKQDLWSPSKQIHYHATLHAGETTLEASLARVLMQSIVKTGGVFDKDHFRQAYVEFMMRPGSHNDTYASTCHRMFFANKIYQGRPDDQCPDNDGHNVDTIDGLVLPTITALAVAARAFTTDRDRSSIVKEAETAAKATASVTRRSDVLERAAAAWSRTVVAAVLSHNDNSNNDNNDYSFATALQETATAIGMRRAPTTTGPDQMTACYLDSAMPALLDSVAKYTLKAGTGNNRQQTPAVSVKTALLNNANAGGENVHRGSCLGAVLGAHAGMEHMPPELVTGLYHHDQLAAEIDEFVAAVLRSNNKEDGKTQ